MTSSTSTFFAPKAEQLQQINETQIADGKTIATHLGDAVKILYGFLEDSKQIKDDMIKLSSNAVNLYKHLLANPEHALIAIQEEKLVQTLLRFVGSKQNKAELFRMSEQDGMRASKNPVYKPMLSPEDDNLYNGDFFINLCKANPEFAQYVLANKEKFASLKDAADIIQKLQFLANPADSKAENRSSYKA